MKTVLNFTRFYSPWNNTKEFRKYLIDGKFLDFTHGSFTSGVSATKKVFNWPKHCYTKIFKKQIGSWHPIIQQASKFQRRI